MKLHCGRIGGVTGAALAVLFEERLVKYDILVVHSILLILDVESLYMSLVNHRKVLGKG